MVKKSVFVIGFLILILGLFFIFQNKKNEEKTFSFWTIQLKAPAGDIINKNIEKFKKLHPDIKVVWVDIPIAEAQKRTIASILGGNPPDLINLNPEFSLSLAQKNTLEFFNEADAKNFNEGLVNKLKYDGKIYALPFYATSAVTILNKEKFKNCKINLKTYDDILKLSSCKNPPVFGASLNEGDSFSKILNKYDVNSKTLNEKNLKNVYFKFYDMNKNGLLLKDTLTITHRENIEKYMSGSASFIVAGSNFISMIKENAPAIYNNSILLPQLTGSNGEYDISIMNFIIPKKAKNKEYAKEFINLMTDYKSQMALAKKTNVLPANKIALNDDYFKNCDSELMENARCIAAKQLNNPIKNDFGYKNKKEINDTINNYLEILLLKGKGEFRADELHKKLTEFIQN